MSAQGEAPAVQEVEAPVELHPVTEVLVLHWAQMYSECREQYQTAVHLNERLERRCDSLLQQSRELHHELGDAHLELQAVETMTMGLSRLVLKMLRENPELAERYRDDYHEAIRPTIIDLTADDEEMDED